MKRVRVTRVLVAEVSESEINQLMQDRSVVGLRAYFTRPLEDTPCQIIERSVVYEDIDDDGKEVAQRPQGEPVDSIGE